MTSLDDTPTPTMLTAEFGSASIKIEQGVLCENSDEYIGSKYNSEKRDLSTIKFESNHPSVTGNDSNGMGEDNNMFNITHSIFQPDFEIKSEPDVDIDDRHPYEETEENTRHSLSPNDGSNIAPKIRLTPTSKLIATPNGSTDNKRRYVCPYENCTKSYGKSSHLRSHLTWHTGIKPFVCKEPGCGKGFTRSDELNRHIRTHTGEKPFECVQCTKKFSRSDHLTKHLATHTKQLAASNSTIPKKAKIDKNSPQGSKKMVSSLGSETMKNGQNILTTLPLVGTIDVKDNPDTKELNFDNTSVPQYSYTNSEINADCPQATQMGSLQIKLEKPENSYDYIKGQAEKEIKVSTFKIPSVDLQDQNIKQEINVVVKSEPSDDMQLSHKDELTDANEPDDDAIMPEANLPPLLHSSPIKSTSVKPKASCQLNQTFNHIADSVYDPTRPFPCCHCTKNFKRQDDLNRHMRTHTGEKPFACNECDKRFMRSDHLKKHMNTHTRVR